MRKPLIFLSCSAVASSLASCVPPNSCYDYTYRAYLPCQPFSQYAPYPSRVGPQARPLQVSGGAMQAEAMVVQATVPAPEPAKVPKVETPKTVLAATSVPDPNVVPASVTHPAKDMAPDLELAAMIPTEAAKPPAEMKMPAEVENPNDVVHFKVHMEKEGEIAVAVLLSNVAFQMETVDEPVFSASGEVSGNAVRNWVARVVGEGAQEKLGAIWGYFNTEKRIGSLRLLVAWFIEHVPLSPQIVETSAKTVGNGRIVFSKPLALFNTELDYYSASAKPLPVPKLWADVYGEDSWTPTTVYFYKMLVRRHAQFKDDEDGGKEKIAAWQENWLRWSDALNQRAWDLATAEKGKDS